MDLSQIPPAELKVIPAMVPPPGYTSNFTDPSIDGSNVAEYYAVVSVWTGMTVLFLALRLYTRIFVVRKTGWDDYLAIGATIGAIAHTSVTFYIYDHGFGVHQWNLSIETLLNLTDYLNTALFMYYPVNLLAKLSLCVFFFNIFGKQKRLRWAIYFAMGYCTILQVATFFLAIFLCLPGSAGFWKCSNRVSILNVVSSGFNFVIDLYLLIVPLVGIWRLQMQIKRKAGLLMTFGIGVITCVASILGFYYRLKQTQSSDISWHFAAENIVAILENDATIVVGCALVLPALLKNTKGSGPFSSIWSRKSSIFKKIVRSSGSQSLRSNSSEDSRIKQQQISTGSMADTKPISDKEDPHMIV